MAEQRKSRSAKKRKVVRNRIIFGIVVVALIALIVVVCSKLFNSNDSSNGTSDTAISSDGDVTGPTITGAKDITIKAGETVSYRNGVTVEDDTDPNPSLEIDTSAVDINTPGTYQAVYIATDASGNETRVTITVTVEEAEKPSEDPATQEEIDKMHYLAKLVLKNNKIVSDDMSNYEKAQRIWIWINFNSDYANTSDKSSWVRGAIQYFDTHKGDCFNYFAAAKALLEECGIRTIDVVKSDTSHSSHYWSLINIGDGWYHFDTTPREGKGDYFFMVTDEQLDAYSEAHDNSHIFDHDAYPARATAKITDMNAQPDYYSVYDK